MFFFLRETWLKRQHSNITSKNTTIHIQHNTQRSVNNIQLRCTYVYLWQIWCCTDPKAGCRGTTGELKKAVYLVLIEKKIRQQVGSQWRQKSVKREQACYQILVKAGRKTMAGHYGWAAWQTVWIMWAAGGLFIYLEADWGIKGRCAGRWWCGDWGAAGRAGDNGPFAKPLQPKHSLATAARHTLWTSPHVEGVCMGL